MWHISNNNHNYEYNKEYNLPGAGGGGGAPGGGGGGGGPGGVGAGTEEVFRSDNPLVITDDTELSPILASSGRLPVFTKCCNFILSPLSASNYKTWNWNFIINLKGRST